MIPIEFDVLVVGESRLMIKPDFKILINKIYEDNYLECAKAIVHELRHLFQILWAALFEYDKAKIWKEELKNPINSGSADILDYATQNVELDAFAFTKHYLVKYEGMVINHPNVVYEELISKYIKENKRMM